MDNWKEKKGMPFAAFHCKYRKQNSIGVFVCFSPNHGGQNCKNSLRDIAYILVHLDSKYTVLLLLAMR